MTNDRRRQRKHGTHDPPFETPERHKLGHIFKQGTCWGTAAQQPQTTNGGIAAPYAKTSAANAINTPTVHRDAMSSADKEDATLGATPTLRTRAA